MTANGSASEKRSGRFRFSESELQAIIWTLDYHETYDEIKSEFENEHKRIENILEEIKDPVKETYDRLYDILWDSPEDKFTIRFYQAHSTGIDQNKVLKNAISGRIQRDFDLGISSGTMIDIQNKDSRAEFNKAILSIVHYLVKYPYSYMVVKSGDDNFLIASLTEILSEDFIKTSFSTKPSVIGGALSSYAVANYENWMSGYFDEQGTYHPGWNQDSEHWAVGRQLWTLRNIYPIYLFSDGNSGHFGTKDFAERLVKFFATLTGEKYRGIHEISRLTNIS